MIDEVAELSEFRWIRRGACDLKATAARIDGDAHADITATDYSKSSRHPRAANFTQRNDLILPVVSWMWRSTPEITKSEQQMERLGHGQTQGRAKTAFNETEACSGQQIVQEPLEILLLAVVAPEDVPDPPLPLAVLDHSITQELRKFALHPSQASSHSDDGLQFGSGCRITRQDIRSEGCNLRVAEDIEIHKASVLFGRQRERFVDAVVKGWSEPLFLSRKGVATLGRNMPSVETIQLSKDAPRARSGMSCCR